MPSEKKTLTGSRILWECLEREGVHTIFGYPGGAILPAYDALKHSKIHHILVRHEQGATHMADGYARATGGVGVAVATSGPGATNMVTGIATAMMDSSPIVCITGQVGSKLLGSDAFQETDITGVTLPITKHNYLITRADEVAHVVREAFYVAKSGRPGPVLIDITKDAQQGNAEFDWEAAAPKMRGYRPDLSPAKGEYVKALELIKEAKCPLILAGHGTAALELLEQAPDIEALIAPAGSGGLLSGCAVAAKGIRPEIRVFGAEPEGANDTYLSLRAGRRVEVNPDTIADGLRSGTPGELSFPILQRLLEEVILVSDDEIRAAMKFLLTRMKIVVEPSGAVAAAALLSGKLPKNLTSAAVILSGGNVDMEQLATL